MRKKILIGLGIVFLLFAGFIGYTLLTTKSHSPQDIAEISSGELSVKVVYCQPFKKGRKIFGTEEQEALLPYGKYWRLGANDATEITFSKAVSFAGEPVPAGSYRMYAVPNADDWEISLNSALGEWGAWEPDYSLDVIKVNVPTSANSEAMEQLTIKLVDSADQIDMNLMWDDVMVSVPIK